MRIYKKIATSYPNVEMAESVIAEVLSKSKNVNKIEKWLKNDDPKLEVSGNLRSIDDNYPAIGAWCKKIESIPGYEKTYPPHWKE